MSCLVVVLNVNSLLELLYFVLYQYQSVKNVRANEKMICDIPGSKVAELCTGICHASTSEALLAITEGRKA